MKPSIGVRGEKLYAYFHKASLYSYISFLENRLPKIQVFALIKQMAQIGFINKSVLFSWRESMNEHNALLSRGKHQNLHQWKAAMRLKPTCLDEYMLQMKSDYLAVLLENFAAFGEIVSEKVDNDPRAPYWIISDTVMIEEPKWTLLAKHVMNILHLVHFEGRDFGPFQPSPWPGREALVLACGRCWRVYSRYGSPDDLGLSILERMHRRFFPQPPLIPAGPLTDDVRVGRKRAREHHAASQPEAQLQTSRPPPPCSVVAALASVCDKHNRPPPLVRQISLLPAPPEPPPPPPPPPPQD